MAAIRTRHAGLLALALLAACTPRRDVLPLEVLPAAHARSDAPLVLLLSGDGNWSAFPRALARQLNAAGVPVLGLRSRTWFWHRRTPEETARALAAVTRVFLARWHRRDLVVVGYSRGAEVLPFVLNRWPPELRGRVKAIVLVAMSERAAFEFHVSDLLGQVARSTDVAARPELQRLAGVPMVCVYGRKERETFCSRPLPRMRVFTHPGAHYVRAPRRVARTVVRALGFGH